MPGLASFCVAVALCLGSIYLLMVTWFVAWLTLDERRVENGRNGLIPCITHQKHQNTEQCGASLTGRVLDIYTSVLTSTVIRVVIIVSCTIFLVFGIYGWLSIQQVFHSLKMLPSDSYLTQYRNIYDTDYPDNGWAVDIYSSEIAAKDLENINKLVIGLKDLEDKDTFIKGN